jgi:hypothetical protein
VAVQATRKPLVIHVAVTHAPCSSITRTLPNQAAPPFLPHHDRDILVQETGHRFLKERGIDLIAADSPGAFLDDTPTSKMVRQLLGVISEFEKAALVARLASARKRKRATGVKVDGRKSLAELRPDVVALAKRLARKKPKGGRLSLRAIAAELEAQGHVNERGKRYAATAISRMLAAGTKSGGRQCFGWLLLLASFLGSSASSCLAVIDCPTTGNRI